MNWYEIHNENKLSKIYIYDSIGKWDISAQQFIKDLEKCEQDIEIHLNSPGGDVFEGFAIYNAIAQSDKNIFVYIDGIAASIASVIAMAAKKIFISKNGSIMIHNVSSYAQGKRKDIEKTLKVMEQLETQINAIYVERTGISSEEITNMMDDETWFNADEAVEKGFADQVVTSKKTKNNWDMGILNKYKHVPQKIKEVVAMDELEKLQNQLAATNSELTAKNEKIAELTAITKNYQKQELFNKIENALKEGKLLPAQKDWAEKLGSQNIELLDDYLSNAPIIDLNEEQIQGKGGKLDYRDLLSDPAKLAEVKASNPDLFNKLYNEFMEGK